jgi:hypothetical protein
MATVTLVVYPETALIENLPIGAPYVDALPPFQISDGMILLSLDPGAQMATVANFVDLPNSVQQIPYGHEVFQAFLIDATIALAQ